MTRSQGAKRERLTVQRNDPPALAIVSLTRTGTTATLTTTAAHGYLASDFVTVAGSSVTGWNAKWKLVSVPTTTTATFTVPGALTAPATGTMTVTYTSNATGGQGANGAVWRNLTDASGRDVSSVSAEAIPLSAMETLQIQQVTTDVRYRFKVRVRPDVVETMRILWTPRWPIGMAQKTLTILGIKPFEDGRIDQLLEAAELTS